MNAKGEVTNGALEHREINEAGTGGPPYLIFSPSRHLSNDCCHLRLFLVLRYTALRWEREDTDHRTVTSQLSYNLNKSRTQFISAELPNCLVQIPLQIKREEAGSLKVFDFISILCFYENE